MLQLLEFKQKGIYQILLYNTSQIERNFKRSWEYPKNYQS